MQQERERETFVHGSWRQGTGALQSSISVAKLERALFSFQIIDKEQDLGYGPAQYLTSTQVKETFTELEKITDEIIKSKINGPEMNEIGIYPEIWTESESHEFLIESFGEFKNFYKKAVENNQAIVTFIS